MLTSEFDYNLPHELIAQDPIEPRDHSRLMVIDRKEKTMSHRHFLDVVEFLRPGDLVVWNNSKVFKARLRGKLLLDEKAVSPLFKEGRGEVKFKEGTKGRSDESTSPCPLLEKRGVTTTDRILNDSPVEIFLIRPTENRKVWKVLAKPGRKLRLGIKVEFAADFSAEVLLKEKDGTFLLQFEDDDMTVRSKANMYGEVPTPPYIKNGTVRNSPLEGGGGVLADNDHILVDDNIPREPPSRGDLTERYQTVYAQHEGSVAAPTAGFHFTPELIEKLKLKGVEFAEVTLHIGLGTFQPVKTESIEDHLMHDEWVEITSKNADLINQAKAEKRRVVAVGTTTVRTLEGVVAASATPPRPLLERGGQPIPLCGRRGQQISPSAGEGVRGEWEQQLIRPFSGDINIFISPGFQFKVVDALITNFHLPKSTLFMLVCAFMGDAEFAKQCYGQAIAERYRFFSFGDAMLIE